MRAIGDKHPADHAYATTLVPDLDSLAEGGIGRARAIADGAALAPRLADLRQPSEGARGSTVWVLEVLAQRLAELGRPAEALEAARAVSDEWRRSARRLAVLAQRLAELGRPAEALEAARAVSDEWRRSAAPVAPCRGWPSWAGPPRPSRRCGRSAASGGGPRRWRRRAAAGRAGPARRGPRGGAGRSRTLQIDLGGAGGAVPRLAEPWRRDEAVSEARQAARAVSDEWRRSEGPLAVLAQRLAELGRPAEALEAGRAVSDEWRRSEARRCWPNDWPSWAGPPRPSRRRERSATSWRRSAWWCLRRGWTALNCETRH